MSDELLPYYNRELSYFRRLGAEFAETHPKIAARLRLGPDSSEDPHVERMIEAFAYMNARIRHKLDDDFPELTDALLGVLYPHYLTPTPSMAIVQFQLERSQGDLVAGYTIPAKTAIETEPIDGEPCRFRTCYPVTLWPIELVSAKLARPPYPVPATAHSAMAQSVLHLRLRCLSEAMNFAQLELGGLRFFLRGQAQQVYRLYELIFNNTLEVALAGSARDPAPQVMSNACLGPVGFEQNEGMLPYSARSFLGYRLLTEYFTFPEKFLFFDLNGLQAHAFQRPGNTLDIFVFLNRSLQDLEQSVSAYNFSLGCTPIVNLFQQQAEPILLTHTESEYRIVADARRPLAMEIYSVDRVSASSPDGKEVEYWPFYSLKHAADVRNQRKLWLASRRAAVKSNGPRDPGTEVFLALADLDFTPAAPADWTLHVETTCLNRDLPSRLPFGGDQPRLQAVSGAPLERVICLTAPTSTFRPPLQQGAMWRLISHLSLNHLSLVGDEEGADALREILKLYDFKDSDETRSMIEGILSVASQRIVGRSGSGPGSGLCRGIETRIHFDETRFSGSGLFLFASVLERFLALYGSIHSFSRLVATVKGREGVLRRWPPRAGEKVLL